MKYEKGFCGVKERFLVYPRSSAALRTSMPGTYYETSIIPNFSLVSSGNVKLANKLREVVNSDISKRRGEAT